MRAMRSGASKAVPNRCFLVRFKIPERRSRFSEGDYLNEWLAPRKSASRRHYRRRIHGSAERPAACGLVTGKKAFAIRTLMSGKDWGRAGWLSGTARTLAGVGQVLRRGQEQGRQFVHARLAEACARPGHAEHAESPSVLGVAHQCGHRRHARRRAFDLPGIAVLAGALQVAQQLAPGARRVGTEVPRRPYALALHQRQRRLVAQAGQPGVPGCGVEQRRLAPHVGVVA